MTCSYAIRRGCRVCYARDCSVRTTVVCLQLGCRVDSDLAHGTVEVWLDPLGVLVILTPLCTGSVRLATWLQDCSRGLWALLGATGVWGSALWGLGGGGHLSLVPGGQGGQLHGGHLRYRSQHHRTAAARALAQLHSLTIHHSLQVSRQQIWGGEGEEAVVSHWTLRWVVREEWRAQCLNKATEVYSCCVNLVCTSVPLIV